MYQNYETIDSYEKFNRRARVSRLNGSEHYIVAEYQIATYPGSKIYSSAQLNSCEHFEGESAEGEAMRYYLSLVDPKEFPLKDLEMLGVSWLKDKSYKKEV